MNKTILAVCIIVIANLSSSAQNDMFLKNKAAGIQITNSSLFIGFKGVTKYKISAEIDLGMATLNNDFVYDDFMINLKILYHLREKEKSTFYLGPFTGVEFVNDPTYYLSTPYIGVMVGYEYNFGKKKRNGISLECGYLYGSKDYRKTYSSSWGNVEYIGTFKNNPLVFGLGYSYYF